LSKCAVSAWVALADLCPTRSLPLFGCWQNLDESEMRDVLAAISGAGLAYRVTSEAPFDSSADAHVREVEDAVKKRPPGRRMTWLP
jgi:hypothetical protein